MTWLLHLLKLWSFVSQPEADPRSAAGPGRDKNETPWNGRWFDGWRWITQRHFCGQTATQWEPEKPEVHGQQPKATASTESERGRSESLVEKIWVKWLQGFQKKLKEHLQLENAFHHFSHIWQDLSLPQNSEATHRGAILVGAMFTKDIPAYGILMYAVCYTMFDYLHSIPACMDA